MHIGSPAPTPTPALAGIPARGRGDGGRGDVKNAIRRNQQLGSAFEEFREIAADLDECRNAACCCSESPSLSLRDSEKTCCGTMISGGQIVTVTREAAFCGGSAQSVGAAAYVKAVTVLRSLASH